MSNTDKNKCHYCWEEISETDNFNMWNIDNSTIYICEEDKCSIKYRMELNWVDH